MYNTIVIPLDHSSADVVILNHIRPLAKLMNSRLVLLHCADGFVARNQERENLHDSPEITEDRAYLDDCVTSLRNEGFDAVAILEKGEPFERILSVVDKEKVDLIAMATHGHGPIKDFFLGSVAEKLRHNTSIPILMVRAPR